MCNVNMNVFEINLLVVDEKVSNTAKIIVYISFVQLSTYDQNNCHVMEGNLMFSLCCGIDSQMWSCPMSWRSHLPF